MFQDFFIAILAGGKSERFGMNKALFEIDGLPILLRILKEIPKLEIKPKLVFISVYDLSQWVEIHKVFSQFVNICLIPETADRYLISSTKLNLNITIQVVFDKKFKDGITRAPLIGLYSLFKVISDKGKDGFILFIPCDMPHFEAKIINVITTYSNSLNWDFNALILCWKNHHIEPLISIYHISRFLPRCIQNINENKFKLTDLIINMPKIRYLLIEDHFSQLDSNFNAFTNYNERPN
jgi:molybdopterin-guanine dinucleotide biosynthesis protein A